MYPGQLLVINGTTNDPDGGASFAWNWQVTQGPAGHDGVLANASTSSPTFSATVAGQYTIFVQVTDSQFEQSLPDFILIDVIKNFPPTAVISADVTSGPTPLTVNFDASGSSDPNGGTLYYDWNFGEGTVSTAETTQHTYELPGIWVADVTVTDDGHLNDFDTVLIRAGFIGVSPAEHDFGDVRINDTIQMYFTLSTLNPTSTTIADINLGAGSSSAFSITFTPALPLTLTSAATAEVVVSFDPTATGPYTGELVIGSDDPYASTISIPLFGLGVYVEPPPTDVESILDTFDEAITDGTITGNGPGNSAAGRMGALYNMIEAVGDLIADGDTEGACRQLMDAYKRCAGTSKPPDFITGSDTEELAAQIMTLMSSLGCE